MLEYSGHPLYDVGVATIAAFVGKPDPATLTEADLKPVADYMAREYVRQPLKSFLTVAFPNSGFTNPAFEKTPERRQAYAERVLGCFASGSPVLDSLACVFTGNAAVDLSLKDSDGLPPGRTYRQHVPLLTGEGVINFHPYGDAGLPISGAALLAVQAMPLGCAKVAGRLLAVHSDNPDIIYHFASKFLEDNRRNIMLAQEAGETKLREAPHSQRTLLVKTLTEASRLGHRASLDEELFSLTAYHLTNSGQGADLAIYHLPLQVVGFLAEMDLQAYWRQWQEIVNRAWEVDPKAAKGKAGQEDFVPKRNLLYEDIFRLPEDASRFLRTYFMRIPLRWAKAEKGDPRGAYSLRQEAELVSWDITERFLRRIMGMEKERVEQIRQLGDRLADYVYDEDERFFNRFYLARRPHEMRTLLIRASLDNVRRGKEPLVAYDPYIEVFEEGEEVTRGDWGLVRDLLLIRMIERLHQRGWLRQHSDLVGSAVEAAQQTDESLQPAS